MQRTVKAEGKPASLRDLGAYPNSLLAWRSAVKEKFGGEYNSWRYAKDAKVDCTEKAGQWVVRAHRQAVQGSAQPRAGRREGSRQGRREAGLQGGVRSSSYGAAKKDKKAALSEAETGWELDARKKHGKEYAVWKNATETDIDCHDVKGGIQCIAVGTACK